MKNWIRKRVLRYKAEIKELKEDIYLRGLDVIGTSAFGNMKVMEVERKRIQKLMNKLDFWRLFL